MNQHWEDERRISADEGHASYFWTRDPEQLLSHATTDHQQQVPRYIKWEKHSKRHDLDAEAAWIADEERFSFQQAEKQAMPFTNAGVIPWARNPANGRAIEHHYQGGQDLPVIQYLWSIRDLLGQV